MFRQDCLPGHCPAYLKGGITIKVSVAAVSVKIVEGPGNEEINMSKASDYLDIAKSKGAQIVCFPETYPGPWRMPFNDFSPHAAMSDMAKQKDLYIIYGLAERVNPNSDAQHYVTECLVAPDGKLVGKYNRCCPRGPWIYKGGNFWDINYKEGNELPVFDTDIGKIGMLVCSEVYVPELSRCMAIQGAHITFLPSGIKKGHQEELYDSWKLLIQARAMENLMYTVTCQNIRREERGLTMICSPEKTLQCSEEEGVVVDVVDLDRVNEIRAATDLYGSPTNYGTKAGTLREWRRPKLYGDILCNLVE